MVKIAFSIISLAFTPFAFSDTTAFRSAEISLAQKSHHLQKCREACLANCLPQINTTCPQDMCDRGACKAAKQAYDASKQAYTQAKQALQAAQRQELINQNQALSGKNQAIKGGAKSALKHTKEARKNMGLYAWMGVGTTALLGYMAYKCCKTAFAYLEPEDNKTDLQRFYAWLTKTGFEICAAPFRWSVPSATAGYESASAGTGATEQVATKTTTTGGGSEGLPCSKIWCPIYAAGTVVAGLQTYKMFKQKSKLEEVEKALCEKDAQTGVCSDDNPGAQQAQPKWAEVPGCGGDSSRCQETMCAIDPASPSCGSPKKTKTATAEMTSETLPKRLSVIYSPQGGWPQNQNPFLSPKVLQTSGGNPRNPVVYNLTPSEQQALNNALKAHNQQQQAYLGSIGAGPPGGMKVSSLFGQKINPQQAGTAVSGPANKETYFESENAVAGEARTPSGSNTPSVTLSGSPPAGPWTAGAPGAVPSNVADSAAPQKGQTGSLKQEMDHILNKYYRDGKGQNDPYQGKFTEFGPNKTPVGHKDDNLFLMTHRLHRKMSSNQAFLSYPVNENPSATGTR